MIWHRAGASSLSRVSLTTGNEETVKLPSGPQQSHNAACVPGVLALNNTISHKNEATSSQIAEALRDINQDILSFAGRTSLRWVSVAKPHVYFQQNSSSLRSQTSVSCFMNKLRKNETAMALLPAASNFEFSARSFTLTLTENIFISAGGEKGGIYMKNSHIRKRKERLWREDDVHSAFKTRDRNDSIGEKGSSCFCC